MRAYCVSLLTSFTFFSFSFCHRKPSLIHLLSCVIICIYSFFVTSDGYVSASGTTTAPNGFISISSTVSLRVTQPSQTTGLNSYIVCSKGSNITMYYNNIDITELKFIYAVGTVPIS